jgi:hypothetical protein
MKSLTLLAVVASLGSALPQDSPPKPAMANVPKNMGKNPVPFGPKPGGCSAFEILVGVYTRNAFCRGYSDEGQQPARGTSEPGPFGVIAGDPLVAGVAKLVQGSRGYAVQVRFNC